MSIDYAAIKSEVTTQTQYAAAYTAKDVNGIQAIYNAKTVNGLVGNFALLKWSAGNGLRASIQDLSANTLSPLRPSALALLDVIQGAATGLDLSDAGNIALLNAWVTAGVLTATQEAQLVALSQTPRSVSIADLAFALYYPSGAVK